MRVAFTCISCFACAVEVSRSPRLANLPLIVGDADVPKRVLYCSVQANRKHVRPGMTIRSALAQCPEAVVVPPDPVLYRHVWEGILDALEDMSPEVEDAGLGSTYLNLGGLTGRYESEASLCEQVLRAIETASSLRASIGLSAGKFVSRAAAQAPGLSRVRIVPLGAEAGFLAPLSVELLPCDAGTISRLRLFALDTLGDIARLTVPELQSQFGFKGERLWQLANGIDMEPLRPRSTEDQLVDSVSFETPVAGIDVLVAGAKQLFSRLYPSLRGRAMRELTLEAELTSGRGWERRLVLREAVSETERLVFVLRSALQNAPPPTAVQSLSLRLAGLTGETGKQLRLSERGRLQRQLEEAIRQLKARYGYSPVFRCVDVEPWSAVPEERQILVESDG